MIESPPLPADWFTFVVADGVDCKLPGIYEWRIDGRSDRTYIGKYTRISRPKRAYSLNVAHLLANEPYRKSSPKGFRRIHRALAEAKSQGCSITLTILENPPLAGINRREQELIGERGTLNGPMLPIAE